jgi:hypothetical protein
VLLLYNESTSQAIGRGIMEFVRRFSRAGVWAIVFGVTFGFFFNILRALGAPDVLWLLVYPAILYGAYDGWKGDTLWNKIMVIPDKYRKKQKEDIEAEIDNE